MYFHCGLRCATLYTYSRGSQSITFLTTSRRFTVRVTRTSVTFHTGRDHVSGKSKSITSGRDIITCTVYAVTRVLHKTELTHKYRIVKSYVCNSCNIFLVHKTIIRPVWSCQIALWGPVKFSNIN
jgi:hypothetical protein